MLPKQNRITIKRKEFYWIWNKLGFALSLYKNRRMGRVLLEKIVFVRFYETSNEKVTQHLNSTVDVL